MIQAAAPVGVRPDTEDVLGIQPGALLALRREILPDAGHLDARLDELARGEGAPSAFRFLISSKDFRKAYSDVFAGIGYDYRMGQIDHDVGGVEKEHLLNRVQREWEKLGEEDPHWSVLSEDKFRRERAQLATASFFNSGVQETRRLIGGLRRQGIRPPFEVAVEYGCGLGRISLALAAHCNVLHAYDISEPHLKLARQAAADKGVHNVQFEVVKAPAESLTFEYDLFYSALVFQHNPPPIIADLVRNALSNLKKGGVAVFQVPVFRKGYSFIIGDYLAGESNGIEMHCLPQRVIFDLIEESGCRLVDCFETSVSLRDRILSDIFTVVRT